MNQAEIKRRVLESCGDNPDTPVFFSDTQLGDLATEAMEILAEDVKAIKRQAFVPLREGIGFIYTPILAPDFMAPTRIWNHDLGQRLTCLSMAELDAININWQATTGNPEVWFPVSWDMFGVYPRPADAGGVLRVDYLAWPRELMDDDDRPELPEATHDAVVLYGQYMACLKKWDGDAAQIALRAFQAHQAIANPRSGINRMSVRSFHRSTNPNAIVTPSTYQGV